MRLEIVLFLCPLLFAQTPPAPDPGSLARIEGTVANSVTGEPLRKAELVLHGGTAGEYTAISDSSGHFAIERIAPGSYNLTAQHQNFAVLNYGSTRPGAAGTRLNLTAGQSMTGLAIKLTPFGVISGRVVDQDGDPVTGVPIMLMHWGFTRGGRQLLPSGSGTSTNDRGEFRVYNLAPGRYFLVARPIVRPDGFPPVGEIATGKRIPVRSEPRESFVMTFYPSAPDVTTATPISLNAGQEVPGVDVQLRRARTYTIQGKIAGAQRGRRYSVSIHPQEANSSGNFGMTRGAAVRPDDGTFAFRGVAPGQYTLIAVADNRVSARQELTVGDGDLDGLVITPVDPGAVKGKIQMESGPPKTSLKGLRVSLTPVDGVPMNLPNANTSDDGSFAIDDVPADRYKVNCSPMQGAYLKTIRWSGQVLNDGIVEMTGGGSASLELVFAPTSAIIEGDVKTADDQPAPGTSVLLSPASRRESDFRIVTTDQNGHFSAKGVAPGAYSALATDAQIFSMPDAALLKALEKLTTPVTVDENGHATLSLRFAPAAAVEALQ